METKSSLFGIIVLLLQLSGCRWSGRLTWTMLVLLSIVGLDVQAQFAGGGGRGDYLSTVNSTTEVSIPAPYVGGVGRGDIVGASGTLMTEVSIPAPYVGGVGRGDIVGTSGTLTTERAPCVNPTSAGVIAAAQSGTTSFDPVAFTSSSAASGETARSNTNGNLLRRVAALALRTYHRAIQ